MFLKIQKTCGCKPERQQILSKKINRKNTMKFDIILPFWKAFLIFRFELLVLCSCAFPQNETTIARVNSTQLYYIQKAFCTHLVPGTTSPFSRPFEIILGESSSRLKFIWLLFCASLAKNLGNWRCLTFFYLLKKEWWLYVYFVNLAEQDI